jgi:GT2 family glycosyltransferase
MRFAYIVTIHNSEQHLQYVLNGLKKVARGDVYCVLDGCTDRSEEIVDEYGFNKIITPNVRETKAITTALKEIPKDYDLYFILQDDVVLQDPKTEDKISDLYSKYNIGVLGMRHGCNLEKDWATNGKHSSETDLICNEFQPDMGVSKLPEGEIVERQIVYKSPICISKEVVDKLGGYDDRFEPIAHDDTEYCIRAILAGYTNYVYALKVMQPIQWGGTRRFSDAHHAISMKYHVEHMDLIRKLYSDKI